MKCNSIAFALCGFLALSASARGQPTFKLEVKPNLKPLATLKLEGTKFTRSELTDDPGFRLQYAFKKDGKPLTTVEARSNLSVEIPDKTPGNYSVVLELFYPAYKGGTEQKGQFKPVTEEINFQVKPPTQAGGPVQVVVVEKPKPPAEKKP